MLTSSMRGRIIEMIAKGDCEICIGNEKLVSPETGYLFLNGCYYPLVNIWVFGTLAVKL